MNGIFRYASSPLASIGWQTALALRQLQRQQQRPGDGDALPLVDSKPSSANAKSPSRTLPS
ncbi:hypothetical protein DMH17_17195 [Raoultella planticola]|nr:hypothetical protein [Raoultella planticola]